MSIQIINKRRPSNVIGDAITAATQGFTQGQKIRQANEENKLARAKYDLEMQKLQNELQPVDPTSDLIADPGGSGMFYSKVGRKWINPKSGQMNMFLPGMLPANEPQREEPLVDADGNIVDENGNVIGRA